MALSLTEIQDRVRWHADDRRLNLTTTQVLNALNAAYRGLLNPDYRLEGLGPLGNFVMKRVGRRFPEAYEEDTSLTTSAGTATYTWPTSTVFREEPLIEILDANSSEPTIIPPAPDMETWSFWNSQTDQLPRFYRKKISSGTVQLEFRPAPAEAETIRISGAIQVPRFQAALSTTVDSSSASGQAVVNVASTKPFKVGMRVVIDRGNTNEETGSVKSISSGASITLQANLSNTHAADVVVEPTTIFLEETADEALSMVVAAAYMRKRGDRVRAAELVNEALGQLPWFDMNPDHKNVEIHPYPL